jgi:hypothetical protein
LKARPIIADLLSHARPEVAGDGTWKLIFENAFHAEAVRKCLSDVQAALSAAVGRSVSVTVEVGKPRDSGAEAAEIPAPDEAGPAEGVSEQDVTSSGGPTASPLKKAERILGGTVKFKKK